MDFAPDPDHELIADAIAARCADFDDAYWAAGDDEHRFPWEFYGAMAADGWVGLALPEAYGGGGRGITEAAILMREVAKSDQELQRAIEAIELARDEANRNVDREQHFADQASMASDGKDSNRAPSEAVEAEQTREADLDVPHASADDGLGVEQQNSPASSQEKARDGHGQPERLSRPAAEPVRSDPPQQHVPRLRQIEREIEERHERAIDDRER